MARVCLCLGAPGREPDSLLGLGGHHTAAPHVLIFGQNGLLVDSELYFDAEDRHDEPMQGRMERGMLILFALTQTALSVLAPNPSCVCCMAGITQRKCSGCDDWMQGTNAHMLLTLQAPVPILLHPPQL